LLGSMRSDDGRILVEGFYDGVRALSADDRAQIATIPFDETNYKAKLGIDAVFGEAGFTTLERAWGRPTIEVNGIWGGFIGEGTKTVLPSQAHAKITCRLVADQDPAEIVALLDRHVATHTPPGVKVTLSMQEAGAYPYLMPADHPGNQAARDVLMEMYGKEPLFVRSGGTIPVCAMFLTSLGVYTVNFAFGLNDERIHSPNEFFRLQSFERGQRGYCLLLHRLHSSL
jgi:acetylornithine deacetylase/succinyl-diaminopimelate desuccinylase-like protein